MRVARLAVAALVSLSCGCACMIAAAGKDLSGVWTKEEMHAELGEPVAWGVADGKEYEEFRTRQVIAKDQWQSEGYGILCLMTCCAPDLVCVPVELCGLGRRAVFGQTIRVTYDKEGAVRGVERDGEPILGPVRRRPVRKARQERIEREASSGPVGGATSPPGSP